MHQKITLFRMAHAMASHAGARQAVIAQNIANADTPGYRPRDLVPFADMVTGRGDLAPRATRAKHFDAETQRNGPKIINSKVTGQTNPNGNGVSLEEQMLHAVDVKRQHDRALAIYKFSLGVLRSSIGQR
ncbi:FlgB family protein [Seohaeicola saemankumensis]|uniref:FlgB family protein n=1 Tax=Seohaeicola saemankumensis TaxID=481181 RepID=UPI001E391784|nr:FlgB family protein [Seohaeicola saemankumensis]MCD1625046.1 FlgB family protein [Seohaeicola saemankumensis]